MRLPTIFTFSSLILAACGGSDATPDAPMAKDVGFNKPAKGLHANMNAGGSWADLGPADLACLNTPSADMATTLDVTFATATADTSAYATVTVPTGTKRFGFKMTTTDGQTMPTFLLNQYIDPSVMVQPAGSDTDKTKSMKIQSVSTSTANTLPALIGETRTPMTGVIAGALRDCQHREMSNFVATVSSTQGTATPLTGAEAYYFSAGVELPVHHQQQESASGDGLFMVIQLPAAPTAYVQMWGYLTDADATAGGDMKLIAELQVPVLAETVITGSYEPARQ
jgi:hypothetical protein